jgi:multisubunit Na+/H+ antiporter MnhG subunit
VSAAAVDVLLAAGVAAQLLSCAGLALMRTSADRLHYASAGYSVGPICILAAVLIREHASTSAWEAVAAVAVLVLAGPVVVHATARVVRRVDQGEVVLSEEGSE